MILGAKGIGIFSESMGKALDNEATGTTILVVMGKEIVYEVMCCQWVDIELVAIELDGDQILKKGDMVRYEVLSNEVRSERPSWSFSEIDEVMDL